MFKHILSRIGAPLTAAAALMFGAGSALAQHHGGGHGGSHGGHVSSGHVSSGHISAGHAGTWHGGHGNTWHGGSWNGYHGGYYSHHDYWRGRYWRYPYLGAWWGYPYWGGLYGYSYPYSDSGYYDYAPDYYSMPDYYGYYPPTPQYDYGSYVTPAAQATAHIDVRVPNPDAEVWFEEQPTAQRGDFRRFESPLLDAGRTYAYIIRARWDEAGRTLDQSRQVRVHAGDTVTVDFTRPQPPPPPESSTGS